MAAASILACATPPAWVAAARESWRALLLDHASCEKKAASTAIALMFAYPEDRPLTRALGRLAREELQHFEQVERLRGALGVDFQRQRPGRYAMRLRAALTSSEPQRKIEVLLAAALIEARSAERFALLAPVLPQPMADLYRRLEQAEARHFELYLDFAARAAEHAGGLPWRERLAALAQVEGELATSADAEFRFHSGPPC